MRVWREEENREHRESNRLKKRSFYTDGEPTILCVCVCAYDPKFEALPKIKLVQLFILQTGGPIDQSGQPAITSQAYKVLAKRLSSTGHFFTQRRNTHSRLPPLSLKSITLTITLTPPSCLPRTTYTKQKRKTHFKSAARLSNRTGRPSTVPCHTCSIAADNHHREANETSSPQRVEDHLWAFHFFCRIPAATGNRTPVSRDSPKTENVRSLLLTFPPLWSGPAVGFLSFPFIFICRSRRLVSIGFFLLPFGFCQMVSRSFAQLHRHILRGGNSFL